MNSPFTLLDSFIVVCFLHAVFFCGILFTDTTPAPRPKERLVVTTINLGPDFNSAAPVALRTVHAQASPLAPADSAEKTLVSKPAPNLLPPPPAPVSTPLEAALEPEIVLVDKAKLPEPKSAELKPLSVEESLPELAIAPSSETKKSAEKQDLPPSKSPAKPDPVVEPKPSPPKKAQEKPPEKPPVEKVSKKEDFAKNPVNAPPPKKSVAKKESGKAPLVKKSSSEEVQKKALEQKILAQEAAKAKQEQIAKAAAKESAKEASRARLGRVRLRCRRMVTTDQDRSGKSSRPPQTGEGGGRGFEGGQRKTAGAFEQSERKYCKNRQKLS